jgi:hypothetical protein
MEEIPVICQFAFISCLILRQLKGGDAWFSTPINQIHIIEGYW